MTGFATIDFETTGLFPSKHDRAIEVAVVHSDPDGTITGRWETLINPGRDLGPQRIHAIRAADVRSAPTFADIAAELVELLSGRVVVAHNASFDQRFLLAELDRIAYWAPQFDPLCTMRLARDILPGAGRGLADCCAAFDIDLTGAHRASVDAFATAQLLEAYIASMSDWSGWASALADAQPWAPHDAPRLAWFSRDDVSSEEPADFLERITVKLPEHAGPAEHQDYLALLDRCLIDRHLSATEADAQVATAESLSTSRDTAARLHDDHVAALAAAWADAVLADAELPTSLRWRRCCGSRMRGSPRPSCASSHRGCGRSRRLRTRARRPDHAHRRNDAASRRDRGKPARPWLRAEVGDHDEDETARGGGHVQPRARPLRLIRPPRLLHSPRTTIQARELGRHEIGQVLVLTRRRTAR